MRSVNFIKIISEKYEICTGKELDFKDWKRPMEGFPSNGYGYDQKEPFRLVPTHLNPHELIFDEVFAL